MEWISVKDMLPGENSHMVLVVDMKDSYKWMALAHLKAPGDWWIESQMEDVRAMVPTHWQRLPSPPTQDET